MMIGCVSWYQPVPPDLDRAGERPPDALAAYRISRQADALRVLRDGDDVINLEQ